MSEELPCRSARRRLPAPHGVAHYLWQAVDYEGGVLENIVTNTRDRKAAPKILKKSMKHHGRLETLVTDSYGPTVLL